MKTLNNQNGFSLIELIFSSFLAVMLLGSFFLAIRASDANGDMVLMKMTMEEQGMAALRKMEHEIRMSAPSLISIGAGGNSITFTVPNEANPTVASTYAVNWTGGHSIMYSVSGTQLIRTDAHATVETTTRKLCNFVSSVTFAVPTSGVVTTTLNLSKTLTNTRILTKTLTARTQVRNP